MEVCVLMSHPDAEKSEFFSGGQTVKSLAVMRKVINEVVLKFIIILRRLFIQ